MYCTYLLLRVRMAEGLFCFEGCAWLSVLLLGESNVQRAYRRQNGNFGPGNMLAMHRIDYAFRRMLVIATDACHLLVLTLVATVISYVFLLSLRAKDSSEQNNRPCRVAYLSSTGLR